MKLLEMNHIKFTGNETHFQASFKLFIKIFSDKIPTPYFIGF